MIVHTKIKHAEVLGLYSRARMRVYTEPLRALDELTNTTKQPKKLNKKKNRERAESNIAENMK